MIKLILLEWDAYARQYRTLRNFEYNGITYVIGQHVPMFVVDLIKGDEAEKREMLKQIEDSLK